MKKLTLAIFLVVLSVATYAQKGSKAIMPKFGYQTERERFLLGAEFRYLVTENIRLAPGMSILLPNNDVTGLDFDLNFHYLLPLEGGLAIYPFAGGAMMNNRWSNSGLNHSWTDFGFNVGAGFQYDLSKTGYLNLEIKYTITEGKDPAYISFGYGIKF